MKINKAEFVVSAYSYEDYPRSSFPEFAFSGRSNVGKSSLLNTLVNRKKLARISSTPGRTQSINFYNINDSMYFVDLPGYGYANVPDRVKDEWGDLINDYLYNRENLYGVIQIIDARHKPTEDDIVMVKWLKSTGLPALIAATKVDKVKRSKKNKQKRLILETLNLPPYMDFTFFSAKSGEGKKNVFSFIHELL